jgi:hypothetical protein
MRAANAGGSLVGTQWGENIRNDLVLAVDDRTSLPAISPGGPCRSMTTSICSIVPSGPNWSTAEARAARLTFHDSYPGGESVRRVQGPVRGRVCGRVNRVECFGCFE